jgi:hypothetical protein
MTKLVLRGNPHTTATRVSNQNDGRHEGHVPNPRSTIKSFPMLQHFSPPLAATSTPLAYVHVHNHALASFILSNSPLTEASMPEESHDLRQTQLQFILVPTIFQEHTSLPVFQVAYIAEMH